jgi:glycosyltransferase 2 family protein
VAPGSRRRLVLAARWTLGCAIVAFLLVRFDPRAVAGTLQHVELRIAVPAILGLVAIHLLGAVAWHDLSLRLADVHLAWWQTISHYYAAQAVGSVTPANLGADAYRLAAVREPARGWATLLLPIVVQRVTSYLALSLVALGAVALLPGSPTTLPIVLACIGFILASSVVVLFIRRPHLFGWPLRLLPQRMRPDLRGPTHTARQWIAALTTGTSLALAFHLGSIAMVYALVLALGGHGAAGPILACIAIARLSILIPLSPSGLGFQEAALSVLFLQIGLSPEMALATALLNRLALVLTVALGTALMVGRRAGTRSDSYQGTAPGYHASAD